MILDKGVGNDPFNPNLIPFVDPEYGFFITPLGRVKLALQG
jgi:hypothetical protein